MQYNTKIIIANSNLKENEEKKQPTMDWLTTIVKDQKRNKIICEQTTQQRYTHTHSQPYSHFKTPKDLLNARSSANKITETETETETETQKGNKEKGQQKKRANVLLFERPCKFYKHVKLQLDPFLCRAPSTELRQNKRW